MNEDTQAVISRLQRIESRIVRGFMALGVDVTKRIEPRFEWENPGVLKMIVPDRDVTVMWMETQAAAYIATHKTPAGMAYKVRAAFADGGDQRFDFVVLT